MSFFKNRPELRQPRFVCEGIVTLSLFAVSVWVSSELMQYCQTRPGAVLDDPILRVIGPIRLTWPIFATLWLSLLLWLCSLAKDPPRLLMGLQAATLLVSLRTLALYLVPLEPSPAIIPLADPIVVRLNEGSLVTNDLFFSGHTSSMFLMFLSAPSRWLKYFLLLGTLFIGAGVVLQHVHYSGDVFAAPFFAYGSWQLIKRLHAPGWTQQEPGATPSTL